jgi:DNA-binding transcriptional LysR family regulator
VHGEFRMEMQQVRYFLALSQTLNFTRAAEECHVTQPALTRSIKLLEDELGGVLIRRERNHSHLTELGRRMLPMLQQCYDAAVSAKSLAKAVQDSDLAPLNIVVSNCVNIAVLARFFAELIKACPAVELKVRRGPASAVTAALKNGEADVGIAGPIENWERLDSWALFREPVELAVNAQHRLGRQNASHVALSELAGEVFVRRVECETRNDLQAHLKRMDLAPRVEHEVENDNDVLALLEADTGVAFLSATAPQSSSTRRLRLLDIELWHTVAVYSVAGRLRSTAAAMLLNLLRAADWAPLGVSEPA